MPRKRRAIRFFFPLWGKIVLIGLVGPVLLVIGVFTLTGHRDRLIELRLEALHTQGAVIVAALAANAVNVHGNQYDPRIANIVLRALAPASHARLRLYDRAGRLTGDTRSLVRMHPREDPAATPPQSMFARLLARMNAALLALLSQLEDRGADETGPLFRETIDLGVAREEMVFLALQNRHVQTVGKNEAGETIVAVTLPLRSNRAVVGALVVSTEGGDIDSTIEGERKAVLQIFLIALAVSVALSLVLARTIARPIRMLARAAEKGVDTERPTSVDPTRIKIPDFRGRADEIGYLANALSQMTDALYSRVEAIESFAADVAHEIKNPLSSLRSAVETFRKSRNAQTRAQLLGVIEHDIIRLDRLVTDISNASRLDAELVRTEMAPFDMVALVRTVADIARNACEGQSIVIDAPEKPVMVHGMEGRIAQVIQNILSNALSFTSAEGEVRIKVAALPRNASMRVRVVIEDDGPGLPDNVGEKIFERFYTERPEGERFGTHSGLGLSIARQIVLAHGGRIWADTSRSKGARFVVELG